MPKPKIGITKPFQKDFLEYIAIDFSVRMAGGIPVKIEPVDGYQQHDIQGLILGGGTDVFPGRFNQTPKKEYEYDPERDEMEVFWAERAIEENIPVLGICRGAQLMNVMRGGSLHMDISTAYEDALYPDGFLNHALFRKPIYIEENTLMYDIFQRTKVDVNSLHKQSIDRLGKNLVINAKEKNGIIQAVSLPDHAFFLGVQFHPEFLTYKKIFRNIFRSLVKAASQRLD